MRQRHYHMVVTVADQDEDLLDRVPAIFKDHLQGGALHEVLIAPENDIMPPLGEGTARLVGTIVVTINASGDGTAEEAKVIIEELIDDISLALDARLTGQGDVQPQEFFHGTEPLELYG